MDDQVEVVGTLRLPLGGINGYRHVRGKQGRDNSKFQGISPKKKTVTKLHDTPREAALAYAQLKQQPREQLDDALRHLDFSSPALALSAPRAPQENACWPQRDRLPLRPELEPRPCEPPCVHVGMPMTAAQLALAHALGMPFEPAIPCMQTSA